MTEQETAEAWLKIFTNVIGGLVAGQTSSKNKEQQNVEQAAKIADLGLDELRRRASTPNGFNEFIHKAREGADNSSPKPPRQSNSSHMDR